MARVRREARREDALGKCSRVANEAGKVGLEGECATILVYVDREVAPVVPPLYVLEVRPAFLRVMIFTPRKHDAHIENEDAMW